MVQKQRLLLLVLLVLIVLLIGFILWRAENEMDQVNQQMPVLGWIPVMAFSGAFLLKSSTHSDENF